MARAKSAVVRAEAILAAGEREELRTRDVPVECCVASRRVKGLVYGGRQRSVGVHCRDSWNQIQRQRQLTAGFIGDAVVTKRADSATRISITCEPLIATGGNELGCVDQVKLENAAGIERLYGGDIS